MTIPATSPATGHQGNGKARSVLDYARAYVGAGLCVVPIPLDGSKYPHMDGWQTHGMPTDTELVAWFGKGRHGIGLVCGAPSGGLELIDFDYQAVATFAEWAELVDAQAPRLREKLCIVKTPRQPDGGFHCWLLCPGIEIDGKTKLAETVERDQEGNIVPDVRGKPKYATLIETRGEGGQGLVPGCPAKCHPSGGLYHHQAGPKLTALPPITTEERQLLWASARSLNRKPFEEPRQKATRPDGDGLRPGEDFDRRGPDWSEILEGWECVRQSGEKRYWRRPGKNRVWSATTGFCEGEDGADLLHVFSSNASPFEPDKSYGKFRAYAALHHRGDLSEAAAALAAKGYGTQRQPGKPAAPNEQSDPAKVPQPLSLGELTDQHTALRPPVIDGLLRRGETMNIIATSKTGKSWLVIDLALTKAMGGMWLGLFETVQGNVLILDNELHPETLADRLRKVAHERKISLADVRDRIFVQPLRGGLKDIYALKPYFAQFKAGQFSLVILDTLYRMLPLGVSENDNAAMAGIYNAIDGYADALGCCFVPIHHSSKGTQADKTVTDVGAGAGAMSRAADAHLVLRQHEEAGVFVLDAAVRSWAPVEPRCLRWEFPLWKPADELNPELLLRPQEQRKKIAGDAREKEYETAVLLMLDKLDPDRKGYGKRQLEVQLGWPRDRLDKTIERLHKDSLVDLCPVEYKSGKGKMQTCLGVKRRTPKQE